MYITPFRTARGGFKAARNAYKHMTNQAIIIQQSGGMGITSINPTGGR